MMLADDRYDERNAKIAGIIASVVLHAFAAIVITFSGISYLYPPPPETSMLIDFEEEVKLPDPVIPKGIEPRAEEPDPTRPVELIRKSESPVESSAQNLTPETKPDDFGDVPTPAPEPKEEPKLDPRAAFPGMARKDTSLTAPHAADNATPNFKAGQSAGNSVNGSTEGVPNARLKGRSVVGNGLPRPEYKVQESGIVVVAIKVDQYGNVKSAQPGADGTTVTNKDLWNAARNAALKAHFSQSAEAPVLQEGTITYHFVLK